ncbi:hypothetical protein WP50_08785 [Lactiplantibacillus plantarum]|nr:hypothetical protein WP50_08785 [Lactiplantibacillus plantarum]
MQYGAIVVTFNRKQLLIESITALLNQTVPPAKIIIIDNHSTDGTKAELQTADILANPSVDYRYLTKNIGGAGFINILKTNRYPANGFRRISVGLSD